MRRRTPEEAKRFLVDSFSDLETKLWAWVIPVIKDARFHWGYGSSSGEHQHHCYPGGLAVHTAEVYEGALGMGQTYGADLDVLRIAAVWHDYYKIYEYTRTNDPEKPVERNQYSKKVGHVVGSWEAWMEHTQIRPVNWSGDHTALVYQVGHCLLAHHGRKEWGSPVEPQTVEAQILHYADMMSMLWGPGRST